MFVGARRPGDDGPTLFDSLAVRSPAEFPGVCVIPTTEHVFVGAGRTMLCYRREGGRWTRAWRDRTDLFWSWGVHDDIVLMSAELELAAWTTYGEPRWSRFVEPPWSYTVVDSTVHLDVKGR